MTAEQPAGQLIRATAWFVLLIRAGIPKETVIDRLRNDRAFTAAVFANATSGLLDAEQQTTLSILRDLVHAHISFTRLAEETGFDEKGLHRMLSRRGNPTTQNLSRLLHAIEQALDLQVDVTAR